jgi:uncharacterized protein (DUF433 family)
MRKDNPHIEVRPSAAGSNAYVGKTRVRVVDIARFYQIALEDLIIERIQKSLPNLTQEEIYAAIQYWREHEGEIDELMREEDEIFKSLPTAW